MQFNSFATNGTITKVIFFFKDEEMKIYRHCSLKLIFSDRKISFVYLGEELLKKLGDKVKLLKYGNKVDVKGMRVLVNGHDITKAIFFEIRENKTNES